MADVVKKVRTSSRVELMELNDKIIDVLGTWTTKNRFDYAIAIDQATLTIKVTIAAKDEQTSVN